MTSGGAEALKAAIRRSLGLIVLLVVLGIVSVNTFKQLRGPTYQASSDVLISTAPIINVIAGTAPSFIDPTRILDTAQALAKSPEVYKQAAERAGGSLGTPSELQAATSVSSGTNNDILTFSAKSSTPQRAIGIANSVANGYIAWRAQLEGQEIAAATTQLRAKLATLGPHDPARPDVQSLLNRLQGIGTPKDAQVVASAESAGKTSPAPAKDSILGASIGLVVALLVVALREAIDTTVRSESDVEDMLSAPVLATVRSLPRRARMVTYGRHEAAFADVYALLAANLSQLQSGNKTVVLAVTSAVSREGKTTTAANLAVSLARRGTSVLLADFDFRKPALSDLFQLPRDSTGVLQVIAGSASLEQSLWNVTLSGARPRVTLNGQHPLAETEVGTNGDEARNGSLRLLPSGGSIRAQSGSISQGLAPLVKQLRDRADFVILDTPPALLTVEMAELSRLIDDVLVVVRQGRVTQRSLRSLGRQTRSWRAPVAGAVLTDAQAGDEQYAYYGAR